MKKIYVGNLPWSIDDAGLRDLFSSYSVTSASVVTDRETGRSRGFGFVEVETDQDAASAISELDGREVGGRPLRVNEAQSRR